MKQTIVIGTRKSLLALWQSNHVAKLLRNKYPGIEVKLQHFVTKGDKILDLPLSKIGSKGLFTQELEDALYSGEIDLAVHSLKDMPTTLSDGLVLTAITERAKAGDAFVSNKYEKIEDLPKGAKLGTSSLRRKAQILAKRSDLEVIDLRGNVDTRLRKLDEGQYDAIILAAAGLERLGYGDRIREVLPKEYCLPAVGQGALAIETRTDNVEVREMLEFLNDRDTKITTDAERAFLGLIEGGCQVPIGVHATVKGENIEVEAVIANLNGTVVLRETSVGKVSEGVKIAAALGEKMLAEGGHKILEEIGKL